MKVYLDMVGCRLNQSELEAYARQFRAAGHILVASPGEADLVVINTCTVTAAAAADSRAKIRQAQRAGAPQIAVTGCWSTLQPQEAQGIAGVQYVIPNERKDGLVREILPEYELEPVARQPIPGARLRTRAFIKVQDGCDQHCTFCVTRLARGVGRSRPIAEVLGDIRAALEESAHGVNGAGLLPSHAPIRLDLYHP
jgi:threonylcarbamoyladenosine tRNA methylthiotransferase MtaB